MSTDWLTNLNPVFEELDEPAHPRFVYCSVCGKEVETDPRGDVLDSSGRCDECRP